MRVVLGFIVTFVYAGMLRSDYLVNVLLTATWLGILIVVLTKSESEEDGYEG